MEATKLLDCGHVPSEHSEITTGYGTDANGKTACYDCCAAMDRKSMIDTGKATLYLVKGEDEKPRVTNWPNSLSFPVSSGFKGRHNMARVRYDIRFNGPDGHVWHGTQYGDNTQICHCKRTKQRWKGET
jgi:hypothetical protein